MSKKWKPSVPNRSTSGQPPSSSSAVVAQSQSWSGPLPPPAALAGYENLVPGAADRILTMAEANNAYLNDMEKRP